MRPGVARSCGKDQSNRKIDNNLGIATKIGILSNICFTSPLRALLALTTSRKSCLTAWLRGQYPFIGPERRRVSAADRCIIKVADCASATEFSENLLAPAKNRQ